MKTSRKFVSKSGSHAALDRKSRIDKANKIIDLLSSKCSLSSKRVLDIGTGSGDIAHQISKHAGRVDSVDLFDERVEKGGYKFKQVNTAELPFEDQTFDIVISNHVVEHIPQQETHIKEALRVLKVGGILYLATPNKYWISDPHYKLFFISWLPRKMSQKYLNLRKGSEANWDIYPASHKMLKNYTKGSIMHKAVPIIIKMDIPNNQLGKLGKVKQVLSKMPESVIKPTQYISPTLVYLVEKDF